MKKKAGRIKEYLRLALYVAITMPLLASAAYLVLTWNLPKINSITDYRPPIITRILSNDGKLCGEFFLEKRKPVPLRDIPKFIRNGFVASEDERFYEHKGIDILSIIRAFIKNIVAGEIVQGGSTITQQVTKSLLLSPEKSISRKIKEALLAYRIERRLTKDDILEIYLNQIYLGHGSYGIESAAELYFGKKARDLTEEEGAILAGLPKAPARYSPISHPRRAKSRQHYVLQRMISAGYLDKEEAERIFARPVRVKIVKEDKINSAAPYFIEEVRRYLENKYGADILYKEGLVVFSTLDQDMNTAATRALRDGLKDLDKRQGFRGPLSHLDPDEIAGFLNRIQRDEVDEEVEEFTITKEFAQSDDQEQEAPLPGEIRRRPGTLVKGREYAGVVSAIDKKKKTAEILVGRFKGIIPVAEMAWARKPDPEVYPETARVTDPSKALSPGDVIRVNVLGPKEKDMFVLSLEQEPLVQGAQISINIETGSVNSLVGGYDYQKSQFNRATQARRQAGSAFKPIYYTAALDKGYTQASVILDAPVVYEDLDDETAWKPKNYEGTFEGPVILREALAISKNNPSVRLMESIGTDYAILYSQRLGIASPLSNDLTLALGSSGVTLLELTNAYAVFARGGILLEPILVKKVLDRDGNVLEDNPPRFKELPEEVVKNSAGIIITDKTWTQGRVISEQTAFIITDLLRNVVEHGTGWRIKALGRPAAGKTGTSEDFRDAWFIGFTPDLAAGVWVGFDTEAPLGKSESGAKAASPIWLEFMKDATRRLPLRDFTIPPGIVFAKIDPKTGLLASPETADAFFGAFKEGSVPTERSAGSATPSEEGFFKYDIGL